jgi:redox-sensitive bicupin YhaK (pirin superfamily)
VAGDVWGTPGPVSEIAAQPLYLDVSLSPGASFGQPVPGGHTALAYIIEGAGHFGVGGDMVEAIRLVVFGDGEQIEVQSESGVRFLFFAGAPFREPIVSYGPFVMNTAEEIMQAIADLQNNSFVEP